MRVLPVPAHFDPAGPVGEIWRVPYEERARDAERLGAGARDPAGLEDAFRICLVAVDVQNTFCIPGFELFVGGRSGTGAVDDNRRLCEFVYRNLGAITQIVPSLDTHQAMQVFHAVWLVDADGTAPASRTRSSRPTTSSRAAGASTRPWRAASGSTPTTRSASSLHYTRTLAEAREVPAHDLAVPRDARRDRPRARAPRSRRRSSSTRSRGARSPPSRSRASNPLHRALLGARPGGDARARRRALGAPNDAADRGAARASTRS